MYNTEHFFTQKNTFIINNNNNAQTKNTHKAS